VKPSTKSVRSEREILEEILNLVRQQTRGEREEITTARDWLVGGLSERFEGLSPVGVQDPLRHALRLQKEDSILEKKIRELKARRLLIAKQVREAQNTKKQQEEDDDPFQGLK